MTKKHNMPTNTEVADLILKEDIIGRNQSIDQHGTVGRTREHLRYRVRRLAGLNPKEARELSKKGISDLSEGDCQVARLHLLDMVDKDKSVDDVGFMGDSRSTIVRVLAHAHGHNDGTTISA